MLLRLFLSRKNTKIYLFIVLLVSLLYSFLNYLSNYYIKLNNENFKDSYIYIYDSTSDVDLSNYKVKDDYTVYKYSSVLFKIDDFLSNNYYLSSKTIKYYPVTSDYVIDDNIPFDIIEVNSNLFNDINLSTDKGTYITLSDWSLVNDISNKYGDKIYVFNTNNSNENVLMITIVLKKMIKIMKVVVILLFIFIFVDLVLDGFKKGKMFRILGAKKFMIYELVFLEALLFTFEFLIVYYLSSYILILI